NNILREATIAYEATSSMSLVELARKGISKKSLLKLTEIGKFSLKQFSELLPVSLRTLQRYNDDDILPSEISEHALLIAEVFARGTEVFDNRDQLRHWLQTPCVGLANQTPFSLLDTSFGVRLVTEELGRLEQGVYA
ncbi:MAG: antitoxin Xre/MbcA/ParS toxin-binding domain-containing protein, partial [Balneolaceae bacterium]|nr:antitoxin Xre/MbcA/ParS toxin-binding domain-containing protein [Balneolaceae bacterium]